jgi:hypothetical protein
MTAEEKEAAKAKRDAMTPEEKAAAKAKRAEKAEKAEKADKADKPKRAQKAEVVADTATAAKTPLPSSPKGKKLDLSFFPWTHEGTDYFTNDRRDVLSVDMEWLGRFDGAKIVEAPEATDLLEVTMRE